MLKCHHESGVYYMKEKYTESVTIKITKNQLDEILQYAAEENRDKSDFIRHCVLTYIKKIKEIEAMRK